MNLSSNKKSVKVLDTTMSYVEVGEGPNIVFLHGNPTSSFLWRNIIPHVSGLGRCLAPDLVGMGDSGPSPEGRYRFEDHARYLDAWFEEVVGNEKAFLVIHDWGSALGFDHLARFPDRILGVCYMEALVRTRTWDEMGNFEDVFKAIRSEAGEQMVLDGNFFIEKVLPMAIMRPLTEEEMNEYRRPFSTRESRLPTLVWPRELPFDGEPADVHERTEFYSAALLESELPKLMISAEPGVVLTGKSLDYARQFKNQREVRVNGLHYVQEDSPNEIGEALGRFITEVRNGKFWVS